MPVKFNELLLKPDIIELYNEGITPNYGYLMNGRFEKDMVKTIYPLKTLSGNPISWEASDTEYLFPVVSLEPKQAGSGDPSPENVRPISGWDEVAVNLKGKNLISDENFQSSEKNGITFTKKGNGVVHIEGTATAAADSVLVDDVPQLPPGTYFGVTSYHLLVVVKKASSGQSQWYTPGHIEGVKIEQGDVIQYYYITVQSGQTVNEDVCIFLSPGESPFQLSDFEPYQPGTTATLTLPETIYGGTVDCVTGEGSSLFLFKELAIADMDNNENYPGWNNQDWVTQVVPGEIEDSALEILGCEGVINITPSLKFRINPSFDLYLPPSNNIFPGLTQSQIKEQYPDLVVQFCLKLTTPEPFQATGNQALTIQPGNHTIYTDGNNISLYRKARRLEV